MTSRLTLKVIISALFAFYCCTSIAESFDASVDRNTVELGDTINFTLTFDRASSAKAPDFRVLLDNFNILSHNPSSGNYIINGEHSGFTKWEFVLEPKTKGKLLIPPFTYEGITSSSIEIMVNEPSVKNLANKDVMLETIVDKSSAYVQEQIKVTFRLYYSVNIEIDPGELNINDVVLKSQKVNQYQRRIDGKLYRVADVPYIILPQRSGTVVIPRTSWKVRIAKGGQSAAFSRFGRFETRTLQSQEKIIRIKSIPDSFPKNATWLPARSLSANENWSSDIKNMVAGEPITQTIIVKGEGIESAQIPEILKEQTSTAFKSYIEPAKFQDSENQQGLIGLREENRVFVVSSAGEVPTPEISIPWWNTEKDKIEYLVIPSSTLIASSPNGADTYSSTQSTEVQNINLPAAEVSIDTHQNENHINTNKDKSVFNWLTLLLLCTNIALIVIIIFMKMNAAKRITKHIDEPAPSKTSTNEKDVLKSINASINTSNINELYNNLRLLASISFKNAQYKDLISFAAQCNQNALKDTLVSIERYVFSNQKTDVTDGELSLLQNELLALMKKRIHSEQSTGTLVPLFS